MATQIVSGKIVEITKMSVAGGDLSLAQGMKYFINLRLNYEGVTEEELIGLASEGSSVRVKAQAKLRKMEDKLKESVYAESAGDVDVDDLAWVEFNVATDFESEGRGPRDPEKQAKSAYSKMTDEQKAKFVSENMGVSMEDALKMVKKS